MLHIVLLSFCYKSFKHEILKQVLLRRFFVFCCNAGRHGRLCSCFLMNYRWKFIKLEMTLGEAKIWRLRAQTTSTQVKWSRGNCPWCWHHCRCASSIPTVCDRRYCKMIHIHNTSLYFSSLLIWYLLSRSHLNQFLQLALVHTGVPGQELQLLGQDGQTLGAGRERGEVSQRVWERKFDHKLN